MNRRWAWIAGACVAAVAFANVWLAASPADSSRRSRALAVIDGTVLTPTLRGFGPVTGDALGPAPAPTAYAFVPALAVDVLAAAPHTSSNEVPHFARRRAMDWEVPPTNFTLALVQEPERERPGWIADLLRTSDGSSGAGSGSHERRQGGVGTGGTAGGGAAPRGGGGGVGVAGRTMRAAAGGVSPSMGQSVLEAANAGAGDVPATATPPTNETTRDPNESTSNAPDAPSPGTVQATSGSGFGSSSSGSSGSGNSGSGRSRSPAVLPATTSRVSNEAPIAPAPAVPGLGTSQPDTAGSSQPGDGLTSSDTGGANVPTPGGGALPPLPIDSPLPSFPSTVPGDPNADPVAPMDPHTAAVSTLEGTPPDPAAPPGSTPSRVKDGSLALVSPSAVPEPALLTLLGLAVLGVARTRFRASRP